MAQNEDRVDVILGTKEGGDERVVSIPRVTAERWPEKYPLAETDAGNKTAAARRADRKPAEKKSAAKNTTPGKLPGAGDTTTGAAGAEQTGSTAGTPTTATEGTSA